MKYVYPAIFTPDKEFSDWFQIRFPDLADCKNDGYDLYDAMFKAAEFLNQHMIKLEDMKAIIPAPTYIKDVRIADNEIVTLIKADTDAYRLFVAKCKNL